MGNSPVFMRPREMTHEEIKGRIKIHQDKVRWFEEELVKIKQTKSQQSLSEAELKELKKKRRRLGVLKERHQEKIRELKLKKRR